MAWFWNPKTGLYVNDQGENRTRDQLLGDVSNAVKDYQALSDNLGDQLADGIISPDQYRSSMRQIIKQAYIDQGVRGAGGLEQMNPTEWGSIGGSLAEQYRRLDDFVAEIAAGNLSPAQIQARGRMYIHSSREAYNRANGRVVAGLGFDEVSWELDPSIEDHCDTCLRRNGMGWQPMCVNGGFPDPVDGCVFPADGSTDCLTNDGCNLVYRNSQTGEVYAG